MAGRWKPAADAYRYVLDTHDVQAGDTVLIAVHPWDVHGAIQTVATGAWLGRAGQPYPDAFAQPDNPGRLVRPCGRTATREYVT